MKLLEKNVIIKNYSINDKIELLINYIDELEKDFSFLYHQENSNSNSNNDFKTLK